MKTYRLDLSGTGSSVNFNVRIPNAYVYTGRMFVESLVISTGASTAGINEIIIKSTSLNDPNTYDVSGSNNIIARICNDISVNTNQDIRYSNIVNASDVGFPLKALNLSNLQFNITILKTLAPLAPVSLDAGYTWALRLIIIDDDVATIAHSHPIINDPHRAGYYEDPPVRYEVPRT